MSKFPKQLRAAAAICRKANLRNIAKTCDDAANHIEWLEMRKNVVSPELGSTHEQPDCPDPANCPICSAVPTTEKQT